MIPRISLAIYRLTLVPL